MKRVSSSGVKVARTFQKVKTCLSLGETPQYLVCFLKSFKSTPGLPTTLNSNSCHVQRYLFYHQKIFYLIIL